VLHRVGFALPSFNAGRLIAEVQSRAEGNPWLFDLERVVSKIAAERFSTIYLRHRELYPVSIEAPAGRYVSDNPLAQSVDVHADGSAAVSAVADPVEAVHGGATPSFAGNRAVGGGEEGLLSVSLPAGVHRFARVGPAGGTARRNPGAGDGAIISISVDETGSYRVFRR
jgi:hypothetical protein